MATCRCEICGAKNAGKSKNRKLRNAYGAASSNKLLRTRMKRELSIRY